MTTEPTETVVERWVICMPVYTDGRGRREFDTCASLSDAVETRRNFVPKYRDAAWIEHHVITTRATRLDI